MTQHVMGKKAQKKTRKKIDKTKKEMTAMMDKKADKVQISSLKQQIAELKSMVLAMQTPSPAVSSSVYDLDSLRRSMGMTPATVSGV